MKREHQISFWYVIMAMFTVLMLQSYFAQKGHIQMSAKASGKDRL